MLNSVPTDFGSRFEVDAPTGRSACPRGGQSDYAETNRHNSATGSPVEKNLLSSGILAQLCLNLFWRMYLYDERNKN